MFRKIPGIPGYLVEWKTNSVWSEGRKKLLKTYIVKNPKKTYCTPGVKIKEGTGKFKNYTIGRLVLIVKTGVDLSSSRIHTCHIDGNPFNNKPSNLRWDHISNNMKDIHKSGTQKIIHIL